MVRTGYKSASLLSSKWWLNKDELCRTLLGLEGLTCQALPPKANPNSLGGPLPTAPGAAGPGLLQLTSPSLCLQMGDRTVQAGASQTSGQVPWSSGDG